MQAGRSRDFMIAADFCRSGDFASRIGMEIRLLAGNGSVGPLQIRRPDPGETISAEVQACIRRGDGEIVRIAEAPSARIVMLHHPAALDFGEIDFRNLNYSELWMICHSRSDVDAATSMRTTLGNKGKARRSIRLCAVHPAVAGSRPEGRIAGPAWTPALSATPLRRRQRRSATVDVGCMTAGPAWAGELEAMSGQFPEDIAHHVIGTAPADGATLLGALSLDRQIAGVDLLVMPHGQRTDTFPDTLIAAALQAGTPVLLPRQLRRAYGAGPRYYDEPALNATLVRAVAEIRAPRTGAGAIAVPDFVAACRAGPIFALASASRPKPQARRPAGQRPVMFLPSNGVGIGHLTRLLAIARRIDRPVVVASQAPAPDVARDFGFPVEYIPLHAAVDGDFEAWDDWFGAAVQTIADRYDPSLVVHDGNHPSQGLIRAVASRPDCRRAWVRRGMWARTTSPFLANARWCDLVIEPGELARDRDQGITSLLRHEARQVDPIRLLDPDELADRSTAAAALGLDRHRPACLVQPGSGSNRDLLTLLDGVIRDLRKHPGLQIAVAERVTGSVPLTLWPEVVVLRGFPNSQNVRAFDFCISAAGCNSFHEMLGFHVPTIFVANQHPSMDDQYARAGFAQDKAAAFEISENEMHDRPELIGILMEGKARDFLRDNCRGMDRPNGAVTAAALLDRIAEDATGDR